MQTKQKLNSNLAWSYSYFISLYDIPSAYFTIIISFPLKYLVD